MQKHRDKRVHSLGAWPLWQVAVAARGLLGRWAALIVADRLGFIPTFADLCEADCNRSELVCACSQTGCHPTRAIISRSNESNNPQPRSADCGSSDFYCVVTELQRACRFQRGWWTLRAPQHLRRLNYSFHVCVKLAQTDPLCVNIVLLSAFNAFWLHWNARLCCALIRPRLQRVSLFSLLCVLLHFCVLTVAVIQLVAADVNCRCPGVV